jgi:hypothetical protein
VLLALVALVSPALAQSITRRPIIQNPDALLTTMTILWWTVVGDGTVEYRATAAAECAGRAGGALTGKNGNFPVTPPQVPPRFTLVMEGTLGLHALVDPRLAQVRVTGGAGRWRARRLRW